jgi:hypothetical protein
MWFLSSHRIFRRHTERKHDRPHKCPITGCTSEGFGTKVDLDRHLKAVHQDHHLFCPVEGCNRAETAPVKKSFHRRDNLDDHVRRRHPTMATSNIASATLPSSWLETPVNSIAEASLETRPIAKRRRESSPPGDKENYQAKRIKQLEKELEGLRAELRTEKQELKAEKQELKAEKQELKEELKAVKAENQELRAEISRVR